MNLLDQLVSIPQVSREVYGYDEENKPNGHCNWVDLGDSRTIMAWVEKDEHFRERIKKIIVDRNLEM